MIADRFDVIIVGAGAAGLAAGARLVATGLGVTILEARTRIGGRAHTCVGPLPFPLDLGCGWLHSANRNPWHNSRGRPAVLRGRGRFGS